MKWALSYCVKRLNLLTQWVGDTDGCGESQTSRGFSGPPRWHLYMDKMRQKQPWIDNFVQNPSRFCKGTYHLETVRWGWQSQALSAFARDAPCTTVRWEMQSAISSLDDKILQLSFLLFDSKSFEKSTKSEKHKVATKKNFNERWKEKTLQQQHRNARAMGRSNGCGRGTLGQEEGNSLRKSTLWSMSAKECWW